MSGRILAFTPTFGERKTLLNTIGEARRTAEYPFDWHVYCGRPTASREKELAALKDRGSIQGYTSWPENRGQHWATREALKLAFNGEYDWLLRIDDDIEFPAKRWLKRLMERLEDLRCNTPYKKNLFVASPAIRGLKHPPQAIGWKDVNGSPVEMLQELGGGVRIHPVPLMLGFEPAIYAQKRRTDPDQIARWVFKQGGTLVRFPEIHVRHNTRQLEAGDSKEISHERRMGLYWCFLGEGC